MSKLTTPLTTPGCIYLKENVSILQKLPWGGHSCETYETYETVSMKLTMTYMTYETYETYKTKGVAWRS